MAVIGFMAMLLIARLFAEFVGLQASLRLTAEAARFWVSRLGLRVLGLNSRLKTRDSEPSAREIGVSLVKAPSQVSRKKRISWQSTWKLPVAGRSNGSATAEVPFIPPLAVSHTRYLSGKGSLEGLSALSTQGHWIRRSGCFSIRFESKW